MTDTQDLLIDPSPGHSWLPGPCVLLLVDLFIPAGRKGITALLAAFGLAVCTGSDLAWRRPTSRH